MSDFKKASITMVMVLVYVAIAIAKHYSQLDAFRINGLVVASVIPIVLWFRGRRSPETFSYPLGACSLLLFVLTTTVAPMR